MGDYILTRDDVAQCRQFADTIGKSSFKAGGYHVASMDTLNHVAVVGNEDKIEANREIFGEVKNLSGRVG